MAGKSIFHGTYTALITPFTKDGAQVDVSRLTEHIQFQASGNVTGVLPCGTTGETPTLSPDEYKNVIETTVDVAKPLSLKVLGGAGSNNTAHAIELHHFVHSTGCDAALHVSPYYNKPTQEGLYRHFMAIADSCDLPICVYNIPGRTAVTISPETIERISKHPNIQCVKEATGSLDSASEVVARTKLVLMSGDDSLTLPMAAVGGKGVISVLSNIVPDRVSALCDAFLDDRWGDAQKMHFDLIPLARGLLSLATNPIPLKTAMQILGRDTGALRLPLCTPDQAVVDAVKKLLTVAKVSCEAVTV